jgi:CubicO group peptidase (beta-lactamase class C family)
MEVKKILRFSVLLIISFSLSNCKKNKTDVLYDKRYIQEINAARKDAVFYLTHNFAPGGNFAVAKEGKIIYSEGIGLASEDLEVPAARNTKFRIGQVSELFTNLIYQKMVENGILHPDSTVQHYYPDFPEKQFRLPVHHLADHTSGIREPNSDESDWRGLNISVQAGIENFKADSLKYPPGIYLTPNMHNYNLLGAIMEKVTEKKFSTILKEYVTDTLNLENTLIDNPFTYIKGRSDFYDHNFIAQVVHATTRDMRFRAPSEGLLSNAEDLVKFGNALLYSDYFSEKIKARLFEPVLLYNDIPSNMANGWLLMEDENGRKIYGRSGTVTGGGAALLVYPEEELVVACAVNLGAFSDDYPVFSMAQHFLQKVEEQTTGENVKDSAATNEN